MEADERTIHVVQAQWLALAATGLSQDQMDKLHVRLRDYMNSNDFIKGIVSTFEMELGFADVSYGEVTLGDVKRQLPLEVAVAFERRAGKQQVQ